MNGIIQAIDIANVLSLIFSLATLTVVVVQGIRKRLALLYVGLIILWMLHIIIFYGVVLYSRWVFGIASSDVFQLWSAWLRVHGGVSLFILASAMIRFRGRGGKFV